MKKLPIEKAVHQRKLKTGKVVMVNDKRQRQLTPAAQVANIVKKEMKKLGANVRVKSSNFAGGDAVDVLLTEKLTQPQIDKLVELATVHEAGSFDSMQDLYEYNNIRRDIPQVKYFHVTSPEGYGIQPWDLKPRRESDAPVTVGGVNFEDLSTDEQNDLKMIYLHTRDAGDKFINWTFEQGVPPGPNGFRDPGYYQLDAIEQQKLRDQYLQDSKKKDDFLDWIVQHQSKIDDAYQKRNEPYELYDGSKAPGTFYDHLYTISLK